MSPDSAYSSCRVVSKCEHDAENVGLITAPSFGGVTGWGGISLTGTTRLVSNRDRLNAERHRDETLKRGSLIYPQSGTELGPPRRDTPTELVY